MKRDILMAMCKANIFFSLCCKLNLPSYKLGNKNIPIVFDFFTL